MKKYDPIGWLITRHLAHKCIFLRSDSNSAYFFTSIGRGGIFFRLLRASFVKKTTFSQIFAVLLTDCCEEM